MPDHLQIAHEDVVVRHVKSNKRRIQPDIGLCNVFAKQVRLMSFSTQMLLQSI